MEPPPHFGSCRQRVPPSRAAPAHVSPVPLTGCPLTGRPLTGRPLCFLRAVFSYNTDSRPTCANSRHQCSVHAACRDFATGFCCRCVAGYTGSGRQCVAEGTPRPRPCHCPRRCRCHCPCRCVPVSPVPPRSRALAPRLGPKRRRLHSSPKRAVTPPPSPALCFLYRGRALLGGRSLLCPCPAAERLPLGPRLHTARGGANAQAVRTRPGPGGASAPRFPASLKLLRCRCSQTSLSRWSLSPCRTSEGWRRPTRVLGDTLGVPAPAPLGPHLLVPLKSQHGDGGAFGVRTANSRVLSPLWGRFQNGFSCRRHHF